jgi:squalene monooxygenase
MTVAFNDAVLLTDLLKPDLVPTFKDSNLILKQMQEFAQMRKVHCTVINVLAQALYELFSAGDDWKMGVLREACFAYFELGGKCVDHPMGLLAGYS